MASITHAKTNTIADWTQAKVDALIAAGELPPGTTLANIVLPSDWNAEHTISGVVESVVAGTNISVDNTDPANPIVSSLSDRYKTTSSTSNAIVSSGSLTFTVDTNLAYIPLQEVLIVHDASNHMHASVTSYSGTTLIVDIKQKTGSGTYSSWTINLDGTPVDALTGTGITNEIAYFTGGQVLASLPTATYPSLTEIAYVKGVTSAIQAQLDGKVDENSAITGATKTKITYDAKGLVTAGADATTADIADSSNKRYVTDAQLVVIGNTSGTNTGDVTVTDSSEIDFTLTGQNITASLIAGSIDETKLDASVNASLDSADTSVQPARSISTTAPLAGGGDLSANRTISITQAGAAQDGYLSSTDWNTFNNKGSGTVTSVAALTLGTTGTDLSSSVANGTTAPVITLNVPTASAANRGALSSADWSTFNGKQDALGFTPANNTLSNLGTTSINASLTPSTVTTLDLGTSANPWRTLYIGTAGWIEFGSSADVLLVHSSNLLTLVGGSFHIGNNIKIDVTNGIIGNESGGATQDFRWETDTDSEALFVDASADWVRARGTYFTTGYVNFSSTTGVNGYGIRDNAGVVEQKNSSGGWTPIITRGHVGMATLGAFF